MMTDTLTELMTLQHDLQKTMNAHPADMTRDERVNYMRVMVLAATKELGEFLDEIPWKPWASNTDLNVDAAMKELVDTFHFLNNLFLAIGAEMNLAGPASVTSVVMAGYRDKNQVNHDRQTRGYDGKSEKCGDCGRGIDDGFRDTLNDREEWRDTNWEEGGKLMGDTTRIRIEAYQCVCGATNYLEAV